MRVEVGMLELDEPLEYREVSLDAKDGSGPGLIVSRFDGELSENLARFVIELFYKEGGPLVFGVSLDVLEAMVVSARYLEKEAELEVRSSD